MRRLLVAAVLLSLLAGACGSSADPVKLLRDAGAAMKAIKTVQMDATFGPGAKLDEYTLVSATGRVKLPGESELVGKVKQGDSVFQVSVLTTAGDTYLKASILPYTRLSADDAKAYPSAARLLDPDNGLASVIPEGKHPSIDGSESIDGKDCYKVSTEYSPDAVQRAIAPFQPVDTVKATLWIGKDDNLVRRAHISGHLFDAATDSFVEVSLHDFNAQVDIRAPG
jgi:hypothetical protein